MSQPTKGPVVKERVWRFIEALLTHAEDSSNFEIHWETDKGTGRPNFVVKTKRRFLESLAQLKQGEIYEVIETLENLQIWDDRRLKRGKGSEIGLFALKLWSKDAQRNWEQFERVWQGSRTAKSKALEATYNKSGVIKGARRCAPTGDDWREICLAMLEKQKRLTTNQLMSADEDMKFELDDIHVPLALVQHTKPNRISGDVSPEEGSRLYEPTYEEKQRFKYEDFLAQVLDAGVGQSKGRRIALIGEPGAGKTTLLQAIAFWLLEDKNKTLGLPIWISLADLQGRTIKEYLLQTWLENALEVARVTPEQENALLELFKSDRVWLLLDGVDEMAGDSGLVGATHASPLQAIASQLEGWVAKARVVLTCRLNIWEANLNALEDFETYRLLDFDYPDQVKEFICRWFRCRDVPVERLHLDKGEQLWAELDKSEHQRIQDLVKNPLRLALLCSTWQSSDKGLPSTKAGLYQQFLNEFYRWKENRFPTTEDQQEELNAALGCLAKRAIDQEVSRFRLRHKLVREELGDPKQEGSLFWLALQLGWLNKVGLAAESETEEKVYAFFHPTFQEYFAALAINNWKYFLNHVPDNPAQGIYRIFEPQWKEVILLWLGRPQEEVPDKQKEEFIQALLNFNDKCGEWSALPGIDRGFYEFRAYYLAAAGIAEFGDFPRADKIVEQIINWGFGYYIHKEFAWTFFDPIAEIARAALEDTERIKAVTALVELIENCQNKSILSKAAESLGKIGANNASAIDDLVKLIQNPHNEYTQSLTIGILGRICKKHPGAVQALTELIGKSQNELTKRLVASNLGKIDQDNPIAIQTLQDLSQKSPDELTKRLAARSLGKIDKDNGVAIQTLQNLSQESQNEKTRLLASINLLEICLYNQIAVQTLEYLSHNSQEYLDKMLAANRLRRIDKDNPIAVAALEKLSRNSQDEEIRERAAWSLGKIDKGNPTTTTELVKFIQNGQEQSRCLQAADSLKTILIESQMVGVVSALKVYLSAQTYRKEFLRFYACYTVIWHCAQNMTYPAFYQAWHEQEKVGNTTTPNSQSLNQADLPQSLHSAIANDSQLSQTIHLICIDGSQFIEPDHPAAEIYDQMLDQNCPECDSVPETMQTLKLYWNSLNRNSDKRVVLVFYASSSNPYSEAFLTALSKFGGAICVVTSPPAPLLRGEGSKSNSGSPSSSQGEGVRGWGSVQFFAPSQAIANLLEWIRAN